MSTRLRAPSAINALVVNGLDPMIEGHEQVLLARIMDEYLPAADLPISAEDFSPVNRLIYDAIRDIKRDGDFPRLDRVTDRLQAAGNLQKVSGQHGEYEISRIANLQHGPATLADAIERVRAASNARRAAKVGEQLAQGAIAPELALKNLTELITPQRGWIESLDSATVTSTQLASLPLNPRRPLLAEWLCEGDYGIIFSPRGTGKTWLSMLVAKAVSAGGRIGPWFSPSPAKVLYLDGEMPPDLMRDRDKGLGEGEVEFINHAILFDRTGEVLNITDPELQRAILEKCKRDVIKLLIIDNLSTLASGIKENDAYEWERIHNWLLQFRRHGIAVILVHHAGRNGEARGTSKREDAAFWVIALDDAKKQADDKRGARFVSRFTKSSRNTQEEIPPYEWHVVTDPDTGEVSVGWQVAQSMDVFRQWLRDGVTECRQLAEEIHVSPGTISKWAKRAEREGWLRKQGREYLLVEGNENGNEDP